tara:strand:+ start:1012 stop:1230 length:219 start_codon:yes stop_codon:yes gene_type:complete
MMIIAIMAGGIFFIGLWSGQQQASSRIDHLHTVIDECVADVEAKCPALFQYTALLEAQNSALNKKIENCNKP